MRHSVATLIRDHRSEMSMAMLLLMVRCSGLHHVLAIKLSVGLLCLLLTSV